MKRGKNSLLALVSLAVLSAPVDAATYYVNFNSGSNSSAGTSASAPWKTCPGMSPSNLSHSGHSLQPGDIVYFAPGQVWAGQASGQSLTSSLLLLTGGVTYKADTSVYNPDNAPAGTKAILRATGSMANAIVQFRDHPSFETVIDNLELDGNNQVTQGIDINHRYAIQTAMDGTWKKILNCYLHDMRGNMAGGEYKYGISARTNVENVLIENTEVFNPPREAIVAYSDTGTHIANWIIRHCLVHGDSSDGQPRGSTASGQYKNGSGYCLKGDVRNAVIEYSTAYNIRSQALFIFDNGSGSTPSNFTVRFNVFHSNGHSGDGSTGVCRITGDGTKTGNFYGNVVLPSPDLSSNPGIYKDGGGTWTGNIYNNTIINNSGNAVTLSGFSGQVRNNLVVGTNARISGGTQSNNVTGSSYSGFKNASAVPTADFFAGTSPTDFRPTVDGLMVVSGSALGAGGNLGATFNGSINGVTRGSSWDIGAFQSGSSQPETIPPAPSDLTATQPAN